MAQRRMVSLKIVDTDLFLEMPASTQNLYFHLITRADDDGFLGNSRKIMKIIGASEDDMKILFSKMLVIPFESGVCVIKHWKIHNYIRGDRYTETIYKDEKKSLSEGHNKVYIPNNLNIEQNVIPQDIPNEYQMETQVRLGKVKLGKDSIGKKERQFKGFESASTAPNIDTLIEHWNTKKDLPHCRFLSPNLSLTDEHRQVITHYTHNEIIKAIDNYSNILKKDPESFPMKYKEFKSFLAKGVVKFSDEAIEVTAQQEEIDPDDYYKPESPIKDYITEVYAKQEAEYAEREQ